MGSRSIYITSLSLCLAIFWVFPQIAYGQSDLTRALVIIEQNNKAIRTAKQKAEAQKLLSRTENAPDDPFVSADYLIGRPVSGGNQVDLIVTQAFDFPTVYSKRAQLVDRKATLFDLEVDQVRQEVLWEAQQIGLHVVYLNRRQVQLQQRALEARRMLDDLEAKFAAGEINALEVNKARIRLLGMEHQIRKNQTEIGSDLKDLLALNGGLPLTIADTTYPIRDSLPDRDSLIQTIQEADLDYRYEQARQLVEKKQVEVTKAQALPQMETGYHYQSVLGQTYSGVHLGLSLPLWHHRNKVKAGESLVLFREQETAHRLHHIEYEVDRLYQLYQSTGQGLRSYREALSNLTTREVLDALLAAKEIDFITYARELDYYYEAIDTYLEVEMTYHLTIAELLKFQLINYE